MSRAQAVGCEYFNILCEGCESSSETRTISEQLLRTPELGHERLDLGLPAPKNLDRPVSVGACCGIGHRLSFNLLTFVWAVHQGSPISVAWPDVSWSVLFNDTPNIKASTEREIEHYDNGYPAGWLEGIPGFPKAEMPCSDTSYDPYNDKFALLFDMPLAQSIVRMLQDSLSSHVLSFLNPIRAKAVTSELHLCAHIREGNGETGDWQEKTWRHIDLISTLHATLASMEEMARRQ